MPPVGRDVLTFVRAKVLFHKLVAIPSEGHVQQFLIAALLHEYRGRQSVEITTIIPTPLTGTTTRQETSKRSEKGSL